MVRIAPSKRGLLNYGVRCCRTREGQGTIAPCPLACEPTSPEIIWWPRWRTRACLSATCHGPPGKPPWPGATQTTQKEVDNQASTVMWPLYTCLIHPSFNSKPGYIVHHSESACYWTPPFGERQAASHSQPIPMHLKICEWYAGTRRILNAVSAATPLQRQSWLIIPFLSMLHYCR